MKNLLLLSILLFTIGVCAQGRDYRNITEKNGKIGIGTNNPDELLTVKGKIHTQEVLVDLNGAVAPDYVFESYFNGTSTLKPSYNLPTLAEIARFIKKNHHLPGVPSAENIAQDGLALKEMNLLLLQKVEELTIYTLEQQKQLDNMKLELENLKNDK